MPKQTIYNITKKRLEEYGLFSAETIEAVASLATAQAKFKTYQEYFDSRGGLWPKLYIRRKNDGVPVVDVPAKTKTVKGALVIHLAMANPLDPNQRFQIATIADANPEYRVIGFGNPSHKPFKYSAQNQNFLRRFSIAFRSDKKPLVAAELDYLESQKVKGVVNVGYSYGAHKALIATHYSDISNLRGLVVVDPVAHPRSIRQLVKDFQRTFVDLGMYVNRAESQIYHEARGDSAPEEAHTKKYLRPINIAIALLLARVDFMELLKNTLEKTRLSVAVAWGSRSELGSDAHMQKGLDELKRRYPKKVTQLRLKDDTHAFANDIYLHAAIVRESLSLIGKK